MKNVWMAALLSLAPLSLAALPAGGGPDKEIQFSSDALAKKIIVQCARVKDGDIVQIAGRARDIELMETLSVEAAKLGADTLLTLTPSDQTNRLLHTEVPAKFDARPSPAALKLAETVTVLINFESAESDGELADVPAERVTARVMAASKIMEAYQKRNVRQINLGNGLYPTATRAKHYGISKAELTKLFHAGLNVDYDKMQATAEAVRKPLAGGKKVKVVTPEGTDLTVEIAGQPVLVSDGVLSDDRIKKGGAACQTWLPAGEVFLVPVAGTAEGKVFLERYLWEGKEVRGLSLTFKKGKLTAMKAQSGLERLQETYNAGGAGKDELSALDIGINPAVRLPKNNPAGLYMAAGTVTVFVGNNVFAGGDNKSGFYLPLWLAGSTVHVDALTLVQGGTLQIAR